MEKELEHRLTQLDERSKSNQKRIDELEDRQDNLDKLVGTVGILADREKRVEDDVKEIKSDVKTLTGKSGKKWDNFAADVVKILVAAVIGFVLAKIGLS